MLECMCWNVFGIIKMKQIMKFVRIATSVALALQSVSELGAIQVKKFDFSLWGKTDLEELKNKDFGCHVAVKLFKDSFRLHYDELRRMNVNSNLLNDNTGKYFLTLNEVIPQEIAKAMFDIEIEGDSVNYVNKQHNQIIECSSSNYKSIKEYDDSNWNYLLLVNVINRVMNSQNLAFDMQNNVPFIKETAERMEKYFGVEYEGKIRRAQNDIEQYFQQLNLYLFLSKCYYCPATLQDAYYNLLAKRNRFNNVANTPLMYTQAVMYEMMKSNQEWYNVYGKLNNNEKASRFENPRMVPYSFSNLLNTPDITVSGKDVGSGEITYQMRRGALPIAKYNMNTTLKEFNRDEGISFKQEYSNFMRETNIPHTITLGTEEINHKELLFIKYLENLETTYKIFDRSEKGIIQKILAEAEKQKLNKDQQLLLEMFNVYLYLTQLMPSEYESIYLLLLQADIKKLKVQMHTIMREISGKKLNDMSDREIGTAFSEITSKFMFM